MPDDIGLLVERCQRPGCYLPNGDHSAEETTACRERWLVSLTDAEAAR